MEQPVIVNLMLIVLIIMTVVIALLLGFSLSLFNRLIKVIDPLQKDRVTDEEPVAASTPVLTIAPAAQSDNDTLILIAAAIAAYGYSASDICVIRPVGGQTWAQTARVEVVHTRNQMY